jgi:hypothetical protein
VGWLDIPTATLALRTLVNDGPTDKRAINKKVLGIQDGVNTIFTTFEFRRVGSFQTPAFPMGIYVNGASVPGNKVIQDDPASGVFQLNASVLPGNREPMTASYYYQWFVDAELQQFLADASNWLGQGGNYITLDPGLNEAAIRFAAQKAYEKAAMKYSTRMSEVFQLEDAPSEDILKAITAFQAMAKDFMDSAGKMRDDFYTRQGQSLAPNYGFALGRVRDPVPRR